MKCPRVSANHSCVFAIACRKEAFGLRTSAIAGRTGLASSLFIAHSDEPTR